MKSLSLQRDLGPGLDRGPGPLSVPVPVPAIFEKRPDRDRGLGPGPRKNREKTGPDRTAPTLLIAHFWVLQMHEKPISLRRSIAIAPGKAWLEPT